MPKRSMLLPCLFAVLIDIVIKFAREDVLSELLYDEDLVFIDETIDGIRNEFENRL